MPDHIAPYSHQIDHIIPIRQNGSSALPNLAYACLRCNNSKGTDVAVYDHETGEIVPLFNPRAQAWDDHFGLVGDFIHPRTIMGRVTIEHLKMNHPDQVETRRNLMDEGHW